MAHPVLAGLVLAVLITVRSGSSQHHCAPFGDRLNETCSSRYHQTNAYLDLDHLMKDAMNSHRYEFVIQTVLAMYKTAFPCAHDAKAAFQLFVLDPRHSNSSIPRTTHEWVLQTDPIFTRGHHFIAGDIELLHRMVQGLADATTPGCVRDLYQRYAALVKTEFFRLYPDFEPPTAAPPTTTPTPRTNAPTTKPTTPTTVPPTTTATTAPTSSTQPSTVGTTSIHAISRCTKCTMLDCLIAPHVTDCVGDQGFCLTTVRETANGREIIRGCATRSVCDRIHNAAECNDIETIYLSHGSKCEFCCSGDNCNRPPNLLPDQTALYLGR